MLRAGLLQKPGLDFLALALTGRAEAVVFYAVGEPTLQGPAVRVNFRHHNAELSRAAASNRPRRNQTRQRLVQGAALGLQDLHAAVAGMRVGIVRDTFWTGPLVNAGRTGNVAEAAQSKRNQTAKYESSHGITGFLFLLWADRCRLDAIFGISVAKLVSCPVSS